MITGVFIYSRINPACYSLFANKITLWRVPVVSWVSLLLYFCAVDLLP